VVREAQLPLSEDLHVLTAELGKDPLQLALFGGEDYELVFTIPRERWPVAQQAGREAAVPVTVIGEVFGEAEPQAYIDPEGMTTVEHLEEITAQVGAGDLFSRRWRPLPPGGWNHLRRP